MASELLTDKAISNAKSTAKPKTLKDGAGLFVLVHPNGSKYFQLRATLHGKEKVVRLGTYPDLSLADARLKAAEARKLIADGDDPIQHKRRQSEVQAAEAETTFQSVAAEWLQLKSDRISLSYQDKIVATFSANVYPRIGKSPIHLITSPEVLATLRHMEARGALELMGKCRAWIRQVFDYAKATGRLKGDNPVSCLVDVLKKAERDSYPSFLNAKDAGEFIRRLTDYHGRPETRLAIWLLMLTAKRPSELRAASWSEFDLDKAEWNISAERMKTRKLHTVTLPRQAVVALNELHPITGYTGLLFPGNDPTKPISEMTLTKAFKLLWPEYRVVPHGCRHFFSTMANEHGHFRNDVIEAALAHKDKDAIRGTYNRATYIKERRELAQWWADELEAMRDGGKVIPINGKAA
ncbi:putative prophage CPS-53 integrase [mine drainage metagenome]|uniref:Putative prophage CPS-53 integrase n=1 Tax=mine drainage metagenome TaxID=410659 RepID=A0A1J5QTH6_9ZZZZ